MHSIEAKEVIVLGLVANLSRLKKKLKLKQKFKVGFIPGLHPVKGGFVC